VLEASAGEFEQLWKHAGNVHGLHVGPDRTRIVTGSFDATARILSPGRVAGRKLEHPAPVQNAVFHPDGVRVATASNDGMARLWRPAAGTAVRRRAYPLGSLQEAVYTADGRYLLTKPDEGRAVVSDTRRGEVLCELQHEGAIRAVAVSPDRSMVFTGSADSVTRLFDVDNPEPRYEHKHQGSGIWTVAFSPHGDRTLMGDFDGTMEMRDARSGKPKRDPFVPGPRIQCVGFSPTDGDHIVVAGDDAQVRILDTDDWDSSRKLAKHVSTVSVSKYSSDGMRLVTGSFDKTARVWDVATGRPLCEPLRHGGPIFFVAVALSRDGRYVVGGTNDGTARLWDVASSKPIGPALDHDAAVFATAFTEDGRVLTGTATATISVWDIDSAPLAGDVERIRLWLEVATGFELDAKGALVGLDADTWKQRHARLDALGGPPNATR
jgi:WD40 repeat protein